MALPHKSVISRNTSSEITQLQDENQSLHFKHKNASSYTAIYGRVWGQVKRVSSTQLVLLWNLLEGLGYRYMIVHDRGPPKLQSFKRIKSFS